MSFPSLDFPRCWYRRLASRVSPLALFERLYAGEPYAFLYESLEAHGGRGRYSFLGARPHAIFTARGDALTLELDGRCYHERGSPLEALRRLMPAQSDAPPVAPFCGGAVGYLGYDVVRWCEPVELNNPDDIGVPDVLMIFPREVLCFDHLEKLVHILLYLPDGHERRYAELLEAMGDVGDAAEGAGTRAQGAGATDEGQGPRGEGSDEATERRSDGGQGAGTRAQGARGCGGDVPPPVASGLRARRGFDIRHSTFDIRQTAEGGGSATSDEATQRRSDEGKQGTGKREQDGRGDVPPPVASGLRARRGFDIRHSTFDIRQTAEGGCPPRIDSNMTAGDFERMVERAREYIFAGDIFQVVLSQRFGFDLPAEPIELYRALRRTNPSPYMYYLHLGDLHIAGSSPELLVRCVGRRVVTRPLAGTRRRGRDAAEDAALADELLHDEKERAEHVMLVDLGRNDLGRVCVPGSVELTEVLQIERHSKVMHLVSNVEGWLRDDCDAFDVVRATFPAGTVSGAPKVRAMQIIEELEPVRRGVYAGAIGYFSLLGDVDLCIAIRTLVMRHGKGYVQAGAGIVADSVPQREYAETVNKACALLEAVQNAK